MYLSGSSPVTLMGTEEPKLSRTPSISPVPATCHLQRAILSRSNRASVPFFMTVPESISKYYHLRLFLQPAL